MATVDHLSPPVIHSPIYECAEVLVVSGFLAGAQVKVYAGGRELVGSARPFLGWWVVHTTRPLVAGDVLRAVQEVGNDSSYPTRSPVTVGSLPSERIDPLTPPQIDEPVLECQQVVSVRGVLPGARVEIYDQPNQGSTLLGRADTPTENASVGTTKLGSGQNVFARQSACGNIQSAFSPGVTVDSAPARLAPPIINDGVLVVGSELIQVYGLITGAVVDVFAGSTRIAGGIAPGPNVVFPTSQPIAAGVNYTAEQSLCNVKSPPSDQVTASSRLRRPALRVPICPGSDSVVVDDTVLGATVRVYVEGIPFGSVTASGTETTVVLGNHRVLAVGESVMATQQVGPTGPVQSLTVTVSPAGASEEPVVLGGHPFFAPTHAESPIPGPVFPRGTASPAGPGPVFRLVACGARSVSLRIERPGDLGRFTIPLKEAPQGHFTGVWDWSNAPAASLPVGEYKAIFDVVGPSGSSTFERRFYVIFDPAEVHSPTRFTFNHTGVWFGTGNGSMRALSYNLHLSDNRIFGWAIGVIAGGTNQWSAASLLLEAEHNRFGYDLNWHGSDVIDLLENESLTQCADDANVLTALLRAVGIPAHPVTADARVEQGSATWSFDTWVEARLVGPHGERWYALHPHQVLAAKGPATRAAAGSTWSEALRSLNDLIVMADEDWIAAQVGDGASDVSYNWGTPCKRPAKQVQVAAWIENLSDDRPDRYWTKPFWECSPDYEPVVRVVLDGEPRSAGEAALGQVEIRNVGAERLTGELTVALAASRGDAMTFVEATWTVLTREVSVGPAGAEAVPFRFRIPVDVVTDEMLMVVASIGEHRGVAHVPLAASVEVLSEFPRRAQLGSSLTLRTTLRNVTSATLRGLSAVLSLPRNCESVAPVDESFPSSMRQSVPPLEAGESTTLDWLVEVTGPGEPTAFSLSVTGPGAGGRRVPLSTSIPDERPIDHVGPTAPLLYVEEALRR